MEKLILKMGTKGEERSKEQNEGWQSDTVSFMTTRVAIQVKSENTEDKS